MNTFTSITYSHSKQNDSEETKKIEYISSIQDDSKLVTTSYNNVIQKNNQIESFNKLLKSHYGIYEQVGSSQNKKDWSIQEFHNNNLNKEYKDAYDKHKFDKYLNECLPHTVDKFLT